MEISLENIKYLIAKGLALFKLSCKVINIKISRTNRKTIFLLNVPSHGNMGDHLIFEAEKRFFAEQLPNFVIHCISTAELFYGFNIVTGAIKDDDIICITGGGFLGSLWPEEELRIRRLIQSLTKNKIVFFPETVYYSLNSAELLKQAEPIYSSHPNLYFTVRDSNSYSLVKNKILKEHSERVFLLPDMALYLSFQFKYHREKILFCIRKDKEKAIKAKQLEAILYEQLKEYYITYTDTQVPYSVSLKRSSKEVRKKLIEFASAKLVVTDRLHGMIYSVITNTPVIVMDNVSHKISQVYDLWLKDVPYVRVVDDPNDVPKAVSELLSLECMNFSNEELKRNIIKLKQIITD
jgi:pyruvyl transferase EpsI